MRFEFILQCSLTLTSIVSAIMVAAIASFDKFVFVAILLQSIHVNGLNNDDAGTHLLLVISRFVSIIYLFFNIFHTYVV